MPKILMKQTKPGSIDGMTINLYHAGQEYEIDDNEISQSLANAFIGAQWATLIRERINVPAPSATMVVTEAPEIKKEEIVDEEEIIVAAPKTKRVFELARELEKPWKEIVLMADSLDIDANKAQSGLTETEVKRIKEEFGE